MGFVEGEGCFSIAIQKNIDRKPRPTGRKQVRKKPALPFKVVPNFRLTIKQDDQKILEEVKETLGVGSIYCQDKSKYDGNCSNICHYYTKSFEDNFKVREFFKDKEFLTTKGQDYRLWCKCLELIEKRQHLTKEGLLEICQIRDQMNPNKNKTKNTRTFELVKEVLEKNPGHIEVHKPLIVHNDFLGSEDWFEKTPGRQLFKPEAKVQARSKSAGKRASID